MCPRKLLLMVIVGSRFVFANVNVVVAHLKDVEKGMNESVSKTIAALRACNVPVQEVAGRTITAKEIVAAAKAARGTNKSDSSTLLWVQAHGNISDEWGNFGAGIDLPKEERAKLRNHPKTHFLGWLSSNVAVRSFDIFEPLKGEKGITSYLDSCHSGHCVSCEGASVLASCQAETDSYGINALNEEIIALVCSQAGDCKHFQSLDGNEDGTITGPELVEHFKKSAPLTKAVSTETFDADDEVGIARFQSECKKHGGELTKLEEKKELRLTNTRVGHPLIDRPLAGFLSAVLAERTDLEGELPKDKRQSLDAYYSKIERAKLAIDSIGRSVTESSGGKFRDFTQEYDQDISDRIQSGLAALETLKKEYAKLNITLPFQWEGKVRYARRVKWGCGVDKIDVVNAKFSNLKQHPIFDNFALRALHCTPSEKPQGGGVPLETPHQIKTHQ